MIGSWFEIRIMVKISNHKKHLP